jgi:hypothetical protein
MIFGIGDDQVLLSSVEDGTGDVVHVASQGVQHPGLRVCRQLQLREQHSTVFFFLKKEKPFSFSKPFSLKNEEVSLIFQAFAQEAEQLADANAAILAVQPVACHWLGKQILSCFLSDRRSSGWSMPVHEMAINGRLTRS